MYSGIGINKLRKMTEREDCTFVLWIGTKRLIKRIITVGMETAASLALIRQRPKNSKREVPMMDIVKKAFLEEQEFQRENGISCRVSIETYTDFIFVNRFGDTQHQGTLSKALRRIIRDGNDQVYDSHIGKGEAILLPHFSCHHLRHTFTTRLIEAGTNVKVMQEILGHADISTTLDIYADVTEDTKVKTFRELESALRSIGI